MSATHSRRRSKRVQRRRRRRVVVLVTALFLTAAVFGGGAYASTLSFWTIDHVTVRGDRVISSNAVKDVVRPHLEGEWWLVYAKRNALIYPKGSIIRTLTEQFPRIRRVDVSLDGLTTLEVSIEEREPYARWCPRPDASPCYLLDKDGYIFDTAATSTPSLTMIGSRQTSTHQQRSVSSSTTATSVPTVVLGSRYYAGVFSDLRQLLTDLRSLTLTPTTVHARQQKDFAIDLQNGGTILVTLTQPVRVTFANLETILEKEDVPITAEGDRNTFREIDLRFGNRVFYKAATSTSETP